MILQFFDSLMTMSRVSGTLEIMMCLRNYLIFFQVDMSRVLLQSNNRLISQVTTYWAIHQCMAYFSIKVLFTILFAVILKEPFVKYQGFLGYLELV